MSFLKSIALYNNRERRSYDYKSKSKHSLPASRKSTLVLTSPNQRRKRCSMITDACHFLFQIDANQIQKERNNHEDQRQKYVFTNRSAVRRVLRAFVNDAGS